MIVLNEKKNKHERQVNKHAYKLNCNKLIKYAEHCLGIRKHTEV